jgi:hypothetical protein
MLEEAPVISDLVSPEPNTGCWLWNGAIRDDGYAYTNRCGVKKSVHRLAYELEYGPIPDGLQIDHLCRVRCCCNPAHLEAVTHKTNMERVPRNHFGSANRSKTHCLRGHELTGDNLRVYRGVRSCRRCRAEFYPSTRKP